MDGTNSISGYGTSFDAYINALIEGRSAIGAPVYFFFHTGTTNLTDESQLINLDAIARIAKKYDLYIRVEDAADSATETPEGNEKLGTDRSVYIRQKLLERGVKDTHIKATSLGGIDEDYPDAASRRTNVTLYLK